MLYTLVIMAALTAIGVTAGGWSLWAPWYKCTVSCGGGVELRNRQCDNPKPTSPADNCVGDEIQTKKCNEDACPTAGGWSGWGEWYSCSKTCGGGVTFRARECDFPPPGTNGEFCRGNSHQAKACNTNACPQLACGTTSTGCYRQGVKGTYIGTVSVTETGRTCQQWSQQSPQPHSIKPEDFPADGGKYPSNHCRNPDGEPRPWCYTLDANKRFELCAIPKCDCPIAFSVASSKKIPWEVEYRGAWPKGPSRVPLEETIYDDGGYFDHGDNSFKAPVKGLYSFSFSGLGMLGKGAALHLYTQRPGQEKYMVARAYDGSSNGQSSGAGASVLVELDVDETASLWLWQDPFTKHHCRIYIPQNRVYDAFGKWSYSTYTNRYGLGGVGTADSVWSRATLFSGKLEWQLASYVL